MNSKKPKVILTGYRATGKTSIGKSLAKRLDINFLDMDKVIEERQGSSIRQMVAEHGWAFFREQEKSLLEELIPQTGLVIATGGGAIMHQETWQKLMKTGLCVLLTADTETIRHRLLEDENSATLRPSLTGKDIGREINEVLSERLPLYRQGSHLAIDTSSRSIDDIVLEIVRAIDKKSTVASASS